MSTVSKTYGINIKKGDVGIEIEVEGENLPHETGSMYWKAEADGSLRNGVEYVLRSPVLLSSVEPALKELAVCFREEAARLDFSHRTSVHIHVNVLPMELYDLKKFVFCAYLLDTVFSKIGKREIKGNRFALRIQDAGGIFFTLRDFFFYGVVPDINAAKYSIINICPLANYGSVEFRSMRGNFDIENITNWCRLLVSLRDNAAKFASLAEAYNLAESSPDVFVKTLIPEDLLEYFKYEGIFEDVHSNLSLLAGLHTLRG